MRCASSHQTTSLYGSIQSSDPKFKPTQPIDGKRRVLNLPTISGSRPFLILVLWQLCVKIYKQPLWWNQLRNSVLAFLRLNWRSREGWLAGSLSRMTHPCLRTPPTHPLPYPSSYSPSHHHLYPRPSLHNTHINNPIVPPTVLYTRVSNKQDILPIYRDTKMSQLWMHAKAN